MGFNTIRLAALVMTFLTVFPCSRASAADDKLETACGTYLTKFCKGVKKGGDRRTACLRAHSEQLSPACRSEINAKQPCAAAKERFCKDVKPGGDRLLACLREHRAELNAACKATIAEAQPKPHPCAAAKERFCKNIKPGKKHLVACLDRHIAELSAACKAEIYKKEEKVEVKKTEPGKKEKIHPCSADRAKFCGDAKPGSQLIKPCLKEHFEELSDVCKATLQAKEAKKEKDPGKKRKR